MKNTPLLPSRGFTLIEMLVTLVLMSIISVLTWQALDATDRATTRTQHQHHDTLLILSMLDQLAQDIAQHALLESPYPGRSGQLTSPDAPVLPRAIQWQNQRLSVMRLGSDGQLHPVIWQIRQRSLVRQVMAQNSTTSLPATMQLDQVERWQLRVWIPQRGWMLLHEAPPGLQARGLEFQIEVRHATRTINYRKVVMLP